MCVCVFAARLGVPQPFARRFVPHLYYGVALMSAYMTDWPTDERTGGQRRWEGKGGGGLKETLIKRKALVIPNTNRADTFMVLSC